jgi:hypothetical protein
MAGGSGGTGDDGGQEVGRIGGWEVAEFRGGLFRASYPHCLMTSDHGQRGAASAHLAGNLTIRKAPWPQDLQREAAVVERPEVWSGPPKTRLTPALTRATTNRQQPPTIEIPAAKS